MKTGIGTMAIGLWAVFGALGCASTLQNARGGGTPLDVVIIPGCPTADDGSLTRCQMGRAAWAAILWERGVAARFISSGGAVHSHYVEADTMAAGMAALGVPADRIYLDADALHTDENMYNGMRIAHALGLNTIGVASTGQHATGGCSMLKDWGVIATPLVMEEAAVDERIARAGDALSKIRAVRVPDAAWIRLEVRERRRAREEGRQVRPPSLLLYPAMGIMRAMGKPWIPHAPAQVPLITWADVLARK